MKVGLMIKRDRPIVMLSMGNLVSPDSWVIRAFGTVSLPLFEPTNPTTFWLPSPLEAILISYFFRVG